MNFALLLIAAGIAVWLIAKLIVLLAPMLVYGAVSAGSGTTAWAFGETVPMTALQLLACVLFAGKAFNADLI